MSQLDVEFSSSRNTQARNCKRNHDEHCSNPDYKTDPFFGLEDKWIETAEGELTHYHEIGEGTPILFLHGSGTGVSAAANWWLNLPSIGEQARCIAIDTIGYGQTVVAPGTAYGIRAWVDHAVRTLDALGIEKLG